MPTSTANVCSLGRFGSPVSALSGPLMVGVDWLSLTVRTLVADTRVHFELSRWSTAAAVFGGACNLLFWIVEFYRDDIYPIIGAA